MVQNIACNVLCNVELRGNTASVHNMCTQINLVWVFWVYVYVVYVVCVGWVNVADNKNPKMRNCVVSDGIKEFIVILCIIILYECLNNDRSNDNGNEISQHEKLQIILVEIPYNNNTFIVFYTEMYINGD